MSVLWGVTSGPLQLLMTVVGTYITDSYRDISVGIFITTMVIKNFVFFGFTCESTVARPETPIKHAWRR